MNKLLGFIFSDVVFSWAKKGLYITIMSLFYGMILASYLFVIGGLITTYNLTTTVLAVIESYNSSASGGSTTDILGVFFQMLTCIGAIDAFNATKLMFFSSVSFLLLRLLWLQTLSTLLTFHKFITPLIPR